MPANDGPAICVDSFAALNGDVEAGKECRIPCRSFSEDCLALFYELDETQTDPPSVTVVFRDDFLRSPNNVPCTDLLSMETATALMQSKEWEEAITVCIPELLPAHIPAKDLKNDGLYPDFMKDALAEIEPCFISLLKDNEIVQTLDSQDIDNLITCSASSVLVALRESLFGFSCDVPLDNCAALGAVDGLGSAICSDTTSAPYLIFGTYEYNAPYCIRACVADENAPPSMCVEGFCTDIGSL